MMNMSNMMMSIHVKYEYAMSNMMIMMSGNLRSVLGTGDIYDYIYDKYDDEYDKYDDDNVKYDDYDVKEDVGDLRSVLCTG